MNEQALICSASVCITLSSGLDILPEHLLERDIRKRAHFLLRPRAEAHHGGVVAQVDARGHRFNAALHVGIELPLLRDAPCSGHSANPENSPIYFFSPLAKSEAKGRPPAALPLLPAGASGSAVRPSDLSMSASTSISLSRLMKRNSLSASSCL